jgi:hypothetical protein
MISSLSKLFLMQLDSIGARARRRLSKIAQPATMVATEPGIELAEMSANGSWRTLRERVMSPLSANRIPPIRRSPSSIYGCAV